VKEGAKVKKATLHITLHINRAGLSVRELFGKAFLGGVRQVNGPTRAAGCLKFFFALGLVGSGLGPCPTRHPFLPDPPSASGLNRP
jgi:hypothetical protein